MGRTEKPLRHREYRGLYRQHFRKQSLKPTQGAKAEQKGIRAFIFKDKCRLSWERKICPRTKSRFDHRDRRPCNFQNPMCIFYRTSPTNKTPNKPGIPPTRLHIHIFGDFRSSFLRSAGAWKRQTNNIYFVNPSISVDF